jgi:hypothetical protein
MGLNSHAFNFVMCQATRAPLGRMLTIGRQSLDVDQKFLRSKLGKPVEPSAYCEPVLLALGATSVDSLDVSDYESATIVLDLGKPAVSIQRFDTIVDGGSLEHIFDVATAFRNLVDLCEIGGRIMHILPVNNLNGHGFWQFSSDLIHSLYCERNGFSDTKVYYASSIDPRTWYEMPVAKPGVRVEIVSIEPIILLSVTRKIVDVADIEVSQPFYAPAWQAGDVSLATNRTRTSASFSSRVAAILPRGSKLAKVLRNISLVYGLATGNGRYALARRCERKIDVDAALKKRPARRSSPPL